MQIISDLILIILLSLIPATFNHFLNYCLGDPMSDEPKTREIFSSYSIWLAERRLDTIKASVGKSDQSIYKNLYQSFIARLSTEDPGERAQARVDFNKTVLYEAQKFWNIEKALGMCPYCTNFWCSVIASIFFAFFIPLAFIHPIIYFLLIPIFSHSILRKLQK